MSEPVDRAAAATGRAASTRNWASMFLRAAVTLAAIGYVASQVNLGDLRAAFARIPASAFLLTIALFGAGFAIAGQRWRWLLIAFGAPHPPKVSRLLHIYLVGVFYATWLPLGVAGDVVRALSTRSAFGAAGVSGSAAVVVAERVCGLTGLLLLAATATLVHPLPGVAGLEYVAVLALLAAAAALGGVASAHRLAPFMPRPLRRHVELIPALVRYAPLFYVALAAVACHGLAALGGHALLAAIDPRVPVAQSLVIIPLAASTAFLPFTLAGLGVREAAFIALYGRIGVAESDALAVSFSMFACNLLLALVGGVLELIAPLRLTADTDTRSESTRESHTSRV